MTVVLQEAPADIAGGDALAQVFDNLREENVLGPTWADFSKVIKRTKKGYETYEAVGLYLSKMYDASRWWLADWLLFGEGAFGDRFYQAAEVTGLSEATLADYLRVAENVPRSRRQERLRFTHHRCVAQRDITPEQQEELLQGAVDEQLTVRQLADRVRVLRADRALPGVNGDGSIEGTFVNKKTQLIEAGRAVVASARKRGGDYLVAGEAMARLRAAIGEEN